MEVNMREIIYQLAVRNAVKHNGKASKKSVLGMFLSENIEYRSRIEEVKGIIDEVIQEIDKIPYTELKSRFSDFNSKNEKTRPLAESQIPPLPDIDKYNKVIMRLAPYPSGPLHIGNARMVILNDYYTKKYKGKLILVFDDTIGSIEKNVIPEAYDLIPEDLRYLGVKWHETIYKSDRIPITYKYCKKLIEMNNAYVCTCDAKKWSLEHRKKGIACEHRNKSVEHNLDEWEKMLKGVYSEGEAVVRMKTGMDLPNPALRDNVIMRISNKVHPRVGDKYKVWPLLEFSWGIDDHLLGITHILRGKDLMHEDRLESIIWDFFKWPKVKFIHYGLISFRNIKLSKTDARIKIEKGIYDGWSDPRVWSIQSLKKRGILPESIRSLILQLGLSLADIKLSPKKLYSINRSKIDPIANRYFFVSEPKILEIQNVTDVQYSAKLLIHPDYPERGVRTINLKVESGTLKVYIDGNDANKLENGEIIRLKDLLNIKIIDKKDLKAEIIPGGINEFRDYQQKLDKKLKIIQWLPLKNNISLEIVKDDGKIISGLGEESCKDLEVDQLIQFERFGFCRVDQISPKIKLYFAHK